MSDFSGMDELLQDFLIEATDLLSGVDSKLVDLERNPHDLVLLNDIFRGFHTIKGGAGFLNATALVTLCHLTENLFDTLRNGRLTLSAGIMDVILSATGTVREMFQTLEQGRQPAAADAMLIAKLEQAIAGVGSDGAAAAADATRQVAPKWQDYYAAIAGGRPQSADPANTGAARPASSEDEIVKAALGRRAGDRPGYSGPMGRREGEKNRDNSIRVDTARLDQVLALAGEIGLTKNRLMSLRGDLLAGIAGSETLQALDAEVGQLDVLVSSLQNAVMKTRMQPIGRLFQKYPRIARDLARKLGKEVELVLAGDEIEVDKTMIEDLTDPIIHLIRNAVDHGVESPVERLTAGKTTKSVVRLEARQEGDHIVIVVADDGRGMNAEKLRAKALEKQLISKEEANTLDDRQSFDLVFLPGFSTAEQVTDVSGRGVGMDVVRTNIQKLSGDIEIESELGKGTSFIISLPLTLAVLPVLTVKLDDQPFAVPLSMVREALPLVTDELQEVGGRATMTVRGEVLPVYPLSYLIGWPRQQAPAYGVLVQATQAPFILAVDGLAGRDDAVIKPHDGFCPEGVVGVTTLANGQIVLILDIKELLARLGDERGVASGDAAARGPGFCAARGTVLTVE